MIKKITALLALIFFFLQSQAQLHPCTLGVVTHVITNAGECSNTGSASGSPTLAAPCTYSWAPGGQTTSTITGLSAGTYTVTITSVAGGCTGTASVTITAPPAVEAAPTSNNTNCGASTGSVHAHASSGTGAYTYLWSPGGATTQNVTGLSAGSYTVTVQDASGCSVTASVSVGSNPSPLHYTLSSTNSGCVPSGTATVNITVGTPPYTFSWNTTPVQTNAEATGLSAGSYTVTVTDPCATSSSSVSITASSTPLAFTTSDTNTSECAHTGKAVVHISTGTPPYTYSWNTIPVQTNAEATGLSAGSYTVTVTDPCATSSSAVTITADPSLTANAVVNSNTGCSIPTGSATGGWVGGKGPYFYSWNTVPAQFTATATGLPAGSYTVTVTDANNCTATASIAITAPGGVTPAAVVNNNSSACLNTGSATASTSTGVAPFTYSWNTTPVQTNANATGLSAGSYTVTITDNNGCLGTTQVTIAAPAALGQTNSSTQTGCSTASGTASIVVTGGTGPYTYNWLPGGQTTPTATGLSAGTYTVHAQDADGCPVTATVTVTSLPSETITFTNIVNLLCMGGSNGSITASVSGGATPYTYSWSPTGGTNATATGLHAGTYILSVTDGNNCTATASATVTQPAAGVTVSTGGITNVTCSTDTNGGAIATPAGGSTPYTYIWTPAGGTGPVATNLSAGTYTVTVTDAGGCSGMATATITSTEQSPLVSFTSDSVKGCAPMCAHFTDMTIAGAGSTLKTWSWNFGNGIVADTADTNVCFKNPGKYNVSLTVTSNQGCSTTLTMDNYINVYSYPNAAFGFGPQPTDIRNPKINFHDSSTDAYGINGWHWSFGDLSDSSSIDKNTTHTYTDTGTFCVTLAVTNKNGCIDSATNCLVIMPQYTLYIPSAFTPNGDGLNDVFSPVGEGMDSYTMRIFNRWGNLVFTTQSIKIGWNGRIGSTPGPEDTYIYDIELVDNLGNAHSYIGAVSLLQ